jgi:hypothetical protein
MRNTGQGPADRLGSFERRLCRRNAFLLREASEGASTAPSDDAQCFSAFSLSAFAAATTFSPMKAGTSS